MKSKLFLAGFFVLATYISGTAQDTAKAEASSAAELAKKLANPVASLISVPLQNNTDYGIGPDDGSKNTLNFQPVIPISISEKLNLITRVIVPIVTQYNILGDDTKQSGISDINATAFFSPKQSKLTWGAGPVFLFPTGTDDLLSTKKFCIGPSALALKQLGPLTIGGLFNQLWSVAGSESRSDVNQLYFQPFFAYNWKSGAGVGLNFEMTQNWDGDTFTGYVIPTVSAVTKLGKQAVSMVVGPRINFAAPSDFKSDFGFRAALIFVYPK